MKNRAVSVGLMALASGMAGWVAGLWEGWRFASEKVPYSLEGWSLLQNIAGISAYCLVAFIAIYEFRSTKKWEGEE